MDPSRLRSSLAALGLNLDEPQLDGLAGYEDALYRANESMNLTRVPREEAWSRHFLDSLLFQDLIPFGAKVLDIGTGPGLPAWPLACARPDLSVTAMDSSGKMLGFLATVPLPNLVLVRARAEESGIREEFDFVTGRALAPLAAQVEVSAAPCAVGGLVVPMRTPTDLEGSAPDLRTLGLRLREIVRRELPGGDAMRAFPVYEKIGKTPARYPRRWAEIKAKPLVRHAV